MTELPVRYARTVDGYNIAFTVEGSGPPLVIVPPPFNHVLRTRELLPAKDSLKRAAEHFMLIHYDHRGQGLSTRGLPEHHRWEDYELDIEAVTEALGIEKFAVYAFGFQRVAIRLAALKPERVAGLILLNPLLVLDGDQQRDKGMIALAESDWDYFLEAIARTNVPEQDGMFVHDVFRASVTRDDFVRMSRSLSGHDIRRYLSCIQAPVCIQAHRTRNAYSLEVSQRLVAEIPGAELMIVEDYMSDRIIPLLDFLNRRTTGFMADDRAAQRRADGVNLSPRELEVLCLLASGRSNQQIAETLVISSSTAAKHVNSILSKTGTANRTEAAAYAHRHGIT